MQQGAQVKGSNQDVGRRNTQQRLRWLSRRPEPATSEGGAMRDKGKGHAQIEVRWNGLEEQQSVIRS